MNYNDFLNRIIDDGITAAKRDYENSPDKLKGAVAGFEACRGKSPPELFELLREAGEATRRAYREQAANCHRLSYRPHVA